VLRIHVRVARFDGHCTLRTWVDRVAHTVATSRVIRARYHPPTLVASDDLESIPDSIDGEERLDRRRALHRLYDLIRELRPIDRQAMLLYLEEVDATTIAPTSRG
jgi:RNA polymerase sigma-70 factor, ECF subfamily